MPRNLSLTIDLMKSRHIHLCGSLIALTAFQIAAKADEKVTYQDNILPLIQANCAKCHNEDKRKADLDLTSYQGLLKGSGSGAVVIAGNPDASKLWKAITQTEDPTMPPNQPPMPDKVLEVFKKWIQGGLLETANGRAVAATKPAMDFTLKQDALEKPTGPPPMPKNWASATPFHTEKTTAITGLAASAWAPLIAVAGQKQVLVYNSDSMALLGVLPFTEGEPVGVQFSRNGQLLFANGGRGATSGRVVVWDVTTGKKLMTLGDDYDTVLASDMRPDQSEVALGGPSRIVKIWSTKTGELIHKIKKHTDWVTAIAFSPNGQMLATADRNGGISVWDPDSAQEMFTLAGHKGAVTALSWRSDSKLLASSSEDGSVKLWEMEEGKLVKSWNADATGVLSVSYAHDGNLVTCGRGNSVSVWDGTGRKLRDLDKCCDLPLRAVFTDDNGRVIASDFDGQVAVWNTKNGKKVGNIDANPSTGVQGEKLAALQR